MKTLIAVLLMMGAATLAHAESGSCAGKSENGKTVSIQYFTNGYSDDNIDYYGKIKIGDSSEATYALYISGDSIEGDVTAKSRGLGLDLGKANLVLSADKKSVSGSVGQESFTKIRCSYKGE